ncbi:MAG: DUF885 family protein, partial [Gammaproteobacteria bacterium]|nr:DUF885 family protein [Gammaproteobacteria bacterium]
MSKSFARAALPFFLLPILFLSACSKPEEPAISTKPASPVAQVEKWEQFVTRQIEEHMEAHPQFAVVQGRHEYDGQLPDWSRAGIEREAARLHRVRQEAVAFGDDKLTAEQQYQREYLLARVDQDLFWIEKAKLPFRSPEYYFGWLTDSLDPSVYITLNYDSLEQRMRAFTRYLENVPMAVRQIRDNLAMPMPRTWLQLGIDGFGGYADYFRDEVPAVWAAVEDEALQRDFTRANAEAVLAMQDMADWLKSNLPAATEDYALGEQLFQEMLWDTERVDISLDDLEAVGRADMARNLQRLNDACAEFAPGATIRDCFAKMSSRKPREGSVNAATDQLMETRKFIEQEELVSIPGNEEAKVAEAPPYARSNFAYINIPGAWEKNQPSVYYISPPNPAWPEAVQADYIAGEADLLFTSVH